MMASGARTRDHLVLQPARAILGCPHPYWRNLRFPSTRSKARAAVGTTRIIDALLPCSVAVTRRCARLVSPAASSSPPTALVLAAVNYQAAPQWADRCG